MSKRRSPSTRHRGPLTAIDLFAGAGGFSLSAINSGFEIRAAIEIDEHSCETYRTNIVPRSSFVPVVYESDICSIDWGRLLKDSRLKRGACDLLLGGPPCQGFSTHRINDTGVGDPRNDLLLEYFRAIAAIKPRFFLVENVSGLLWKRHARHLRRFILAAQDAGYHVHKPVLVNARDFGVPQNRKRLFILGVRDDLHISVAWPPAPTHFDPVFAKQKRSRAWRTAATVFQRPLPKKDENAVHMKHSAMLRKVFASTPRNGGSRAASRRVLPCHKTHDGHKDVYGRIDPRKPGPTMTTGCINPSKGRFVHPRANHAITARHAARFQTFPDNYVFSGGLIAAGRQIGNAVPVRLGEVLISPLRESLIAARTRHLVPNSRRSANRSRRQFLSKRNARRAA